MTAYNRSDRELLAFLIGARRADQLYQGQLQPLFADGLTPVHPKLAAAQELVRRVLAENLRRDGVLTSPEAVRDYLRLSFVGKEHEIFMGLFLDAQNRLIASIELFRGTLCQTSVYPREVLKESLRQNAAAVIFAHNHPSGVSEPSRADEALTQTLKHALALVDVKVLDHFVVGQASVMSFAERGLL